MVIDYLGWDVECAIGNMQVPNDEDEEGHCRTREAFRGGGGGGGGGGKGRNECLIIQMRGRFLDSQAGEALNCARASSVAFWS